MQNPLARRKDDVTAIVLRGDTKPTKDLKAYKQQLATGAARQALRMERDALLGKVAQWQLTEATQHAVTTMQATHAEIARLKQAADPILREKLDQIAQGYLDDADLILQLTRRNIANHLVAPAADEA